MKIEFITNSAFLITLKSGHQILTDPWFTPTYHGSWYNFPPLWDQSFKHYISLRPDYIYISHIHPDHLDPNTLVNYPKDTKIIIGKLPHNHLKRKIQSLGFTNLCEFELGKLTKFNNLEIVFFGDFSGSSEGYQNEVNYAMDTSFLLKDEDGDTIFNVNDNTIQVDNAEAIVQEYGSPTISIVPYSGASMYPHAIKNYSAEEKLIKRDDLRNRKLQHFAKIVQTLKSKYIIPAAGSYVLGGKQADYTKYLHQPTPQQMKEFCQDAGLESSKMCWLYQGDVLDTNTGIVEENRDAIFRDFTEEERYNYAFTLKDKLLDHEKIVIPKSFTIPWDKLMIKARNNLWKMQQKLNIFPQYDIELHLKNNQSVDTKIDITQSFFFALDLENPYQINDYNRSRQRKFLAFDIDSSLMAMVFLHGTIWNNVEIAPLIEVERYPDEYNPTIHELMSFFTL